MVRAFINEARKPMRVGFEVSRPNLPGDFHEQTKPPPPAINHFALIFFFSVEPFR